MSRPINPFTVDLRHAFRPMCQCESCTRTRILTMKGGDRLIMHLDRMNQITRDAQAAAAATSHYFAWGGSSSLSVSSLHGKAAASFVEQTETENRTLRFINEIVAAAGVLHISH